MKPSSDMEVGMPRRAAAFLVAVALACALIWAVLSLPGEASGLLGPSMEQLNRSGVTNPVTAAVLNYRGYDTLLEIGVLLLAVLGVWSVSKAEVSRDHSAPDPVLLAFLRLVLPVMVLIACYLLWIGAFAPGGAFQAGAVLGGAILLWRLAQGGRQRLPSSWLLRVLLVIGLAVFVAVAIGVAQDGAMLLEYPVAHAGTLILVIESAALISIGVTLAALFLGGRPTENGEGTESSRAGRRTP